MSTSIRSSQSLSLRISACHYDNSRKPLEIKNIRFLFVFKLFEIYVFRGQEKTSGRTFVVQSYFAKSYYKNFNSQPRKISCGCFPFPKISENTIQNKMWNTRLRVFWPVFRLVFWYFRKWTIGCPNQPR